MQKHERKNPDPERALWLLTADARLTKLVSQAAAYALPEDIAEVEDTYNSTAAGEPEEATRIVAWHFLHAVARRLLAEAFGEEIWEKCFLCDDGYSLWVEADDYTDEEAVALAGEATEYLTRLGL